MVTPLWLVRADQTSVHRFGLVRNTCSEYRWPVTKSSDDDPQAPPSAEDHFARNLRLLLSDRGMSQEELANEMTARGHSWHQSTVYKVLNGSRKVGLGEAAAAAAILGMPVDKMAEGTTDVVTMSRFKADYAKLLGQAKLLTELTASYNWTQHLLEKQLETDRLLARPSQALRLFPPDELAAMTADIQKSAVDVVADAPPF